MKKCSFEGCTYDVWGGGYCKRHQGERPKKPPKEKKVYARVKPKVIKEKKLYRIPKESKKQAARNRKYRDRLPSWKMENSKCVYPGCESTVVDCHHVIGRGIHTNDEEFMIPLCRPHHDICKSDPKLAFKLGLIETRTIARKK